MYMTRALLIICLFMISYARASHIIGGEILYFKDSANPLKYEVEAVLLYYAYGISQVPNDGKVDVSTINLDFGDGSSSIVMLTKPVEVLGSNIGKATYRTSHIYSSYGNYSISIRESYRIPIILNIEGFMHNDLYLQSTIHINPLIVKDHGISFQDFPHQVLNGEEYIHDPKVNNPDEDSLFFEFIAPLKGQNTSIDNYRFPNDPSINHGVANNVFAIDQKTGKIVWDKPSQLAHYAIAIKVSRWKNGIFVGSIIRDYTLIAMNILSSSEHGSDIENGLLVSNYLNQEDNLILKESGQVQVVDMSGRIVMNRLEYQSATPLPSHLESGLYVVSLTTGDEIKTQKFIIK